MPSPKQLATDDRVEAIIVIVYEVLKKQENKVTLTEKLRLIATRLEFNATH